MNLNKPHFNKSVFSILLALLISLNLSANEVKQSCGINESGLVEVEIIFEIHEYFKNGHVDDYFDGTTDIFSVSIIKITTPLEFNGELLSVRIIPDVDDDSIWSDLGGIKRACVSKNSLDIASEYDELFYSVKSFKFLEI
jgi:hypothetical protein